MKTRFNTYDIICGVAELQKLVGWRVNQIYDVDNKTYLFRMQGTGAVEKVTLLIESGTRFHTTRFEWPKNVAPSGFSMKLRKHLKNKRLEKIQQLGADRIVDFQFGTGDAAYHVILELYDRGNLVLTDSELTTLYILRPHTEGENLRFAMREKYPVERAKQSSEGLKAEALEQLLENAKNGDNLRQILMPNLDCGPSVIEHVLLQQGLDNRIIEKAKNAEDAQESEEKPEKGGKKQKKGRNQQAKVEQKPFDMVNDLPLLKKAVKSAEDLLTEGTSGQTKGYIVQVKEEKPAENGKVEFFFRNIEFHPYQFVQFKEFECATFESFMEAVDEFYSTQESQKIDMKTLQQEREALKKLSNVKNDHAKRLEELTKVQDVDRKKAELITSNQSLVDNAIRAVQSAIASQLSWPDIHELVKEAQANGDSVASSIKQLKLETNHISLILSDPYGDNEDDELETPEATVVDVDLALSAWANARRYYDLKRSAAQKEKKTVDASQKALKSAERKTQQTLKEVRTISNIVKARKVFWFEKFYWFISSENYLVIGGRDAQQNELIVKRYMRPKDIYVHAEIQGASSVIIRNPTGEEIPPKTLLEAGSMAISYSVAWDAKVVTNSYWVTSEQVSKTAPTGEYLATGSFMIRGKKNFLPSCHLIMGLSLLFKLEDSFIARHLGERKVRSIDDEPSEPDFKETEVANDLLSEHSDDSDATPVENVSEPSSNTDITAFPNTEVKIEHDTGRITVKSNSVNEDQNENVDNGNVLEKLLKNKPAEEETTIITSVPSRKKQVSAKKSKEEKARAAKQEAKAAEVAAIESEPKNPSQIKRGQKGKLKKIKQKYKDQDDEEREIRMMILKSSGKEKAQPSTEKVVEKSVIQKEEPKQHKNAPPKNPIELEDADDAPAGGDVDILNSLTGQPAEGDELLFAIPVVAPYQALQNYKFKVKLTPGTGKRGKAAKLALNIFAKEKGCNTREKDLLKSIKEESLARNIPGKVKLSAPQLQKYHK
ncbi:ribosome quality control complex subunit NEMF homolog [Drosophila bipectinata]|uniref:ribosome quality control complex subunit NEMF homolog n=1 Tax=Drosophila bipectinata TaxID=42026 RepID=UPI001C899E12|nr:nuclear export mediator factor NEMF homolog [Drosophila bipectinata]